MKILKGKLINKDKEKINVIVYNETDVKDYLFSNLFDIEDVDFCLEDYLSHSLSKEVYLLSFSLIFYI